jgi:hypothetical protein
MLGCADAIATSQLPLAVAAQAQAHRTGPRLNQDGEEIRRELVRGLRRADHLFVLT